MLIHVYIPFGASIGLMKFFPGYSYGFGILKVVKRLPIINILNNKRGAPNPKVEFISSQ
jgi:hypothetical protein